MRVFRKLKPVVLKYVLVVKALVHSTNGANMKKFALVLCMLPGLAFATNSNQGACSPDPAISPDGFGQAVGEAGETNNGCKEG